MNYTLRQITDAIWVTNSDRDDPEKERQRTYDRARMLRDKGHIPCSVERQQGRTTQFTEADTLAAIFAVTASLNGQSWGVISGVIEEFHPVGNIQGKQFKFRKYLPELIAGIPIFVRLDIISKRTETIAYTTPIIGYADITNLDGNQYPITGGTTQVIIWPLTEMAAPIFEHLAKTSSQDT